MTSNYFFVFSYNEFILMDEKKNILLKEHFMQKKLVFNNSAIVLKPEPKFQDIFFLRKRIVIKSDVSSEEIIFRLKNLSGIWTFHFGGNQFRFHLLRGFKSKLVQGEKLISTIDLVNSTRLGYKDKSVYAFSCESGKHVLLTLVCILMFVAVEDTEGLITPSKNLIGRRE